MIRPGLRIKSYNILESKVSDTLNVKKRDETGTLRMRRLRKTGFIPAVLYGRGGDSVSLTVPISDVNAAIRHGSRVVDLAGDVSESALIKHVQWDQLGSDVLHLDLTRIDASVDIEIELKVEVRGVAPGTKQGGTVQQMVHQMKVACPPAAVPESLEVNINGLELDQSITADQLELPEGVKLLGETDELVIVTCVEVAAVESEEPADFSASPEVIGRSGEDEESGDDS